MSNGNRWPLRVGAAACLVLAGCLFDSRYFQQKAAQKNVAQQQTPRQLQATPAADVSGVARQPKVLRVRANATAAYAAEVVEWPRQLTRLLEDANRILEPTLGAHLELVGTGTWSTNLTTDDLDPMINELRSRDRGDDVDFVVGLVGSLPIFARSFHQLGLGQVMGKHVVLRAINDAREREAIEVELSRLGADEREALYQTRKRHKTTAVLLHEIGHNLGLVHEADSSSIMSTRYDKAMTAFGTESASIMRMTLDHRSQNDDERAFAERLVERFERTRSNWVAAERDTMVASLRAVISHSAASGAEPDAGIDEEALKDVAAADRTIYAQAASDFRQGRTRDAWTKAEPLFTRYPDVYAVQDLRCKLALQLNTAWDAARQECSQLMDITRGKKSPRTK
jgi:hypothetical protein